MFAKIFEQIFDSSIAEDWQVRHVFEDLLKLCDREGVVDRTPEAIARRSNVPLEIVTRAIAVLEQPDPHSRNPVNDGRRIMRLDPNRTWGWRIVNYEHYRAVASDEQRRSKNLDAVHRYREKKLPAPTMLKPDTSPSTPTSSKEEDYPKNSRIEPLNQCISRTVTSAESGNDVSLSPRERAGVRGKDAIPRHRAPRTLLSPVTGPSPMSSSVIPRHPPSRLSCHAEAEAEAEADLKLSRPLSVPERPIGQKPSPPPATEPIKPTKPTKLSIPEKDLADRIEAALGNQWVNDAGKWIGRIRSGFRKTQRVIAELENARKESRIATTPAQYAEDTWQRFAG